MAEAATTRTAERITIASRKPLACAKAALERLVPRAPLVPRLGDDVLVLLRCGDAGRDDPEIVQASTFCVFCFRGHGQLLMNQESARRAVQYDIGNLLTAVTRHQRSASLYAPIRLILRETPERGVVAFEYEPPANAFGQFNNADVSKAAEELDLHLRAVLQKAAR